MNYLSLRQKYPVFSFDKYECRWENNDLIINFYYSCSELKFIHKLVIEKITNQMADDQMAISIFNLGLSLLPSYWKLTCSPTIKINIEHWRLNTEHLQFWKQLFIKGMGEYFYKNHIDFTGKDFLKITCDETERTGAQEEPSRRSGMVAEHPQSPVSSSNRVLVPVGGGKDSIVTLELLKPHFAVTALAINPVPIIKNVIKTAAIPAIYVQNIFDPELFELNQKGYLNGHVPVSAFYAFCSLLVAHLLDLPNIAFSNERSSNEGNTTYLGQEINHQYSKTLEFETDLHDYIISNFKFQISNFSFLRPLYELQITKLFSQYPQYFNIFSSCNNNFKIQKIASKLWCCECPKCVSTALMLSQFIGKNKIKQIMGTYPPELPENQKIMDELTGKSPVKPFECVLTRNEALACVTGQGLEEILSGWQDNPNLPEKFAEIIKKGVYTTPIYSPS